MDDYPVTHYAFSIEDALRSFGFKTIDEKDNGACVACGYSYGDYKEIFVEFNQSFITNYQTDMRIYFNDKNGSKINLYLGVAPTTERDFKMLMNYILPSENFKSGLGIMA